MRHGLAISRDLEKKIVADYRKGLTIEEVAELNNIGYKCAWKYLHRNGVYMRGCRKWDFNTIDQINEDYKTMTAKQLAEKYNVTTTAMYDLLRVYCDKKTDDHRGIYTPVIRTDLNGKHPKEYSSMVEASKDSNVGVKYIRRVCRGLRESTKGYKFYWRNENV